MQNTSSDQLMSDRRKKQFFLKEEIIDKGMDPAKFSEFLCSIKSEGTNIDVWSFDELQSAVRAFKRSEDPPTEASLDETTMLFLKDLEGEDHKAKVQQHSDNLRELNKTLIRKFEESQDRGKIQDKSIEKSYSRSPDKTAGKISPKAGRSYAYDQNDSMNTSSMNSSMMNTSTSLFIQSPLRNPTQPKRDPNLPASDTDNDPMVEIVATQKAEPTQLAATKQVNITITNPEQVKGGMFSGSYVMYTVNTDPMGWSVKRRFNDFYWLRETLYRLHPGIFIPPMPTKKNKNKFQDDVIKKRMFFFEIFLNACMEHQDVKADKVMYHFLYNADANQWQKIKDNTDKIPTMYRVDELVTATGEVKLDVNPDLVKYISLTDSYYREADPIYKKIRKTAKAMVAGLKHVTNLAAELSECFTSLHSQTTSFNKQVSPAYSLRFGNFYSDLTKMVVAWGEQLQKQANFTYKHILCFYKYSDLENDVYLDMSLLRSRMETDYERLNRDLQARKERMFAMGDMKQWNMDPAKTKDISKEELFRNRELAFGLMLPSETQVLKVQRDMMAYMNASVAAEVSRGLEARCFLYNKNFEEFFDNQSNSMEMLMKRWQDLMEAPSESRTRSIARAHLLKSATLDTINDLNKSTTSDLNKSNMKKK